MILKLNGERFNHFSNYNISLIYDSVASTFNFAALRDFAPAPFSFPECTIEDEDSFKLITGTVVNTGYAATKKEQLVNVSGYSLPGVLEDSQIPIDLYPLQSDKLTLNQLIERALAPFGIQFNVDTFLQTDFNQVYTKHTADPGESVKSYINRLVSQRGVIMSHNSSGYLVFTRIRPEKLQVVATFEEGNPGVFEMNLSTNGQAMHNKITVMRQASPKTPRGLQYTITNPYTNNTREKIKMLNSDSNNLQDIEAAARNELGNEIAEAINLKIKTTKLVLPGNTVRVKSARLSINEYTTFFVRQTNINGDTRGVKYELDCVPLDAYSQDEAKNIFL